LPRSKKKIERYTRRTAAGPVHVTVEQVTCPVCEIGITFTVEEARTLLEMTEHNSLPTKGYRAAVSGIRKLREMSK
jgi:hypothetical protein